MANYMEGRRKDLSRVLADEMEKEGIDVPHFIEMKIRQVDESRSKYSILSMNCVSFCYLKPKTKVRTFAIETFFDKKRKDLDESDIELVIDGGNRQISYVYAEEETYTVNTVYMFPIKEHFDSVVEHLMKSR